MPDHTTTSAAQYLAEQGYTVGRGRIGGRGSPTADTIKRWCVTGRIKARKAGWVWLISQDALDRLISDKQKDGSAKNDPQNDPHN